jgi:hypothetical protein
MIRGTWFIMLRNVIQFFKYMKRHDSTFMGTWFTFLSNGPKYKNLYSIKSGYSKIPIKDSLILLVLFQFTKVLKWYKKYSTTAICMVKKFWIPNTHIN